ncbi:MAG: hypothetical protein KGJ97_06335 [Xanthomonadaceae bacterium]|jgi:hypothetical protein|nr:hypothetical protein [Xanthomonadaceae bacterium]MDE3073260.1 hypothetical protein [Pseudomonadota bacterium]
MNQQQRIFVEKFDAMHTNLLLQRYRNGGLVPDAEAALLRVLESRGHSRDQLDDAGRAADAAAARHEVALEEAARRIEMRRARQSTDPVFKRINLALKCVAVPVIAFFVLLAIPVVGNVIVLGGAGLLGCDTGENEIHPCVVLGTDIGGMVYGYVVDAFLVGGLNPFLAVMAFFGFLRSPFGVAWLFIVVGVFAAREIRRYR